MISADDGWELLYFNIWHMDFNIMCQMLVSFFTFMYIFVVQKVCMKEKSAYLCKKKMLG